MATVTGNPGSTASSPAERRMRHSGWRRLALATSIAVGGILISLFLYERLQQGEQQWLEARFQRDAKDRIDAIQREAADRLSAVRVVSAFFAGPGLIQREEFREFVEPLLEDFEGVGALAWVPRVSWAQRPAHEQAIRETGLANYKITQRNGQGKMVAAEKRDEYYPVLFIEPQKDFPNFIGRDLGVATSYYAAIRKAMADGALSVWTARMQAPQNNGGGGGRLIVADPVWNEHPPEIKRPKDKPEIDGFVLGFFAIGSIAKDAMKIFHPLGVDVYIYDSSGGDDKKLVAIRLSSLHGKNANLEPSPAQSRPPETGMHYAMSFPVANRRWTVDCFPMDVYFTRQQTWEPAGALLAGLLITGLLVGWLMLLTGRTARVERMVAERTRELGESEQRFRLLVESATDSFFLRDLQGRIRDVSKWTCESLGYTREELLSMNIADVDVAFVPMNLGHYALRPAEEFPVSFEGVHRRKDGTTFPVEVRLNRLEIGGERMFVGLVRDISRRKKDEADLQYEQRLLRDALDLHERDRKLVAFEIHDGLAQQLTAALYKFQAVEPTHARDPEAASGLFHEAVGLLGKAMAECRRLISGLRPPVLDEAGLVAAIDSLVVEQQNQYGSLEIKFVHNVQFDRLAPSLETAAFRIVQECLTNACRHSKSRQVRIELGQTDSRVRIGVQDWGIGFDSARVAQGHFGLEGIRERTRLLDGAVAIESAPGQGARITIELPLLPPANHATASNETSGGNGDG